MVRLFYINVVAKSDRLLDSSARASFIGTEVFATGFNNSSAIISNSGDPEFRADLTTTAGDPFTIFADFREESGISFIRFGGDPLTSFVSAQLPGAVAFGFSGLNWGNESGRILGASTDISIGKQVIQEAYEILLVECDGDFLCSIDAYSNASTQEALLANLAEKNLVAHSETGFSISLPLTTHRFEFDGDSFIPIDIDDFSTITGPFDIILEVEHSAAATIPIPNSFALFLIGTLAFSLGHRKAQIQRTVAMRFE